MYDKPDALQQWSVHAEVTISHSAPSDGVPSATSRTEQSGNGLRMVYSWTSHPPTTEPDAQRTFSAPSDTASRSSGQTYGFQRGGMLFTSTPPRAQTTYYDPNRLGVNVQDSGYNSELLSPSSYAQSSIPRRVLNPYSRRCRSTCSIILSTAVNTDGHNIKCDTSAVAEPVALHHHCGRTQSLRCQTPTIRPERRELYYGCGDPWCYHADDARRISPVMESCEECSLSNQSVSSKRPSRANTFTTHFCTRLPERTRSSPPPSTTSERNRDMASQTVQTSEKCTSPLEKIDLRIEKRNDSDTSRRKKTRKLSDRRKSDFSSRRNSDTTTGASSMVPPDFADNKKSSKRITRSPAMLRGISPFLEKRSPPRDPTKKPRTVHIDVYCTGSDLDTSSESTSDSDQVTQSSPQTVYESEKVRVSHRRAGSEELPHSLKTYLKDSVDSVSGRSKNEPPTPKHPVPQHSDSEDDASSTVYPSALSSYATMGDFESSLSSVPWSALSTSTCTVPESNTSCKDTVSDFENLFHKQFSLASVESEYFIPRKLNTIETPSDMQTGGSRADSLLPSDSFEYDDSADRDRITQMERFWGGPNLDQKTWKSPQSERKFLLQQQKMREYLEKRVKEKSLGKSDVKDSETESTEDELEQGWSFVQSNGDKGTLKRDGTVRRASKDALEAQENGEKKENVQQREDATTKKKTKLSVTETPEIKVNPATPTTPISKEDIFNKNESSPESLPTQRLLLTSDVRKPFTIVPGKSTEPLLRAQRFGAVIGAIRKPGHHIGPAKNPDCLCDHCRSYYEESMYRNRTRSVGDDSTETALNWRRQLKSRSPDKAVYSDF